MPLVDPVARCEYQRESRRRTKSAYDIRYRKRLYVRKSKLFYAVRARARRRGVPFALELSDMFWPAECPALGIAIDYGPKSNRIPARNSPSIDRVDPRKGYVRGNVQVISMRANAIKSDATPEEVRLVADYCARRDHT